jgi:transcriptional regulator with PAS, ATPase and Fis domain
MCIKASKSISNVLILGESGTGKELIAQSIHNASSRRNEPFIAINCGALPKGLIESELFGYEGGSFTGANKEGKPGKFELADGGTMFLDEIGDMPLDTQVSILRVLQNKEIVRIGGSKSKPIDIRVIAATNKNLLQSIQDNSFREELYYRLNVFTINVPSLRERKRDILTLAEHFISYYNRALNKNVVKINEDVIDVFNKYSWPGNIRELENIIERAINIVESDTITIKDLPFELQKLVGDNSNKDTIDNKDNISLNNKDNIQADMTDKKMNLEKDELIKSLIINNGNVIKSAQQLGISRRTLYRKLDKYNISIDSFR